MISDKRATSGGIGLDRPAATGEVMSSKSEDITIPPFLERKYNLDTLRRRSTWPQFSNAGRSAAGAITGTPNLRRDLTILFSGIVLGIAITATFVLVWLLAGRPAQPVQGEVVIPTATVPSIAQIASPTPPEASPTPASLPGEVATPTELPATSTPEEVPTATTQPTDTAIPEDTAVPTRAIPPTRPAPPRATNTPEPIIIPAPTEIPVVEPTTTIEFVPTPEPPTEEPTPAIPPTPADTPTPLPGIILPTEPPPTDTPTPLPGILTPTPEELPGVLP